MNYIIRGKVFVYGANIDTDQIYPGRYLDLTDPEIIAQHAMEGADPSFIKEVNAGDIIIADTNFGCGSSREHAAVALKTLGVGAILADSFGRIFYRNAINLGLPLLICPGIAAIVKRGDRVNVNISTGEAINDTTGLRVQAQPFSNYVMRILENGGIKSMIKNNL